MPYSHIDFRAETPAFTEFHKFKYNNEFSFDRHKDALKQLFARPNIPISTLTADPSVFAAGGLKNTEPKSIKTFLDNKKNYMKVAKKVLTVGVQPEQQKEKAEIVMLKQTTAVKQQTGETKKQNGPNTHI